MCIRDRPRGRAGGPRAGAGIYSHHARLASLGSRRAHDVLRDCPAHRSAHRQARRRCAASRH
eukprot:6222789-Lingulodinium_polyedra.AAC.1